MQEAQRTWKDRLIHLLGGYDRIDTAFLIHRAGLVANLSIMAKRGPGWEKLVNDQVLTLKKAILRVDPLYAHTRGYDKDIARAKRESGIRGMEAGKGGGKGTNNSDSNKPPSETRICSVLDEIARTQAGHSE